MKILRITMGAILLILCYFIIFNIGRLIKITIFDPNPIQLIPTDN